MKKIINLIAFIGLTLFYNRTTYCQHAFDYTLYKPIPLQTYTPPKDKSIKENSLVVYNMVMQKFDTIQNPALNNYQIKINPKSRHNQNNEDFKKGKNPENSFSNLQPADQLAEFPNFPISPVVKLFLTFYNPVTKQNSFATCSGVMIHPGFILTAAHCVKSKFDSSYVIDCKVVPAYNLGKLPFGLTTTTNWYAFSQWTANGNLDYDIALMKLSNSKGNETGWFDLAHNSDSSFFTSSANEFHSYGYPSTDPLGNPAFEEGERMYYMTGFFDFWESSKSLCHNNIAYPGTSGSGFYNKDSTGKRSVYGVLSHGTLFPPYSTCHCVMDSMMFNYFKSIIPNANGIESNSLSKQILIYPNPSDGVFNIDFSDVSGNKIEINVINILGLQIMHKIIKPLSSNFSIDLTDLPNGPYYVQITIDGRTETGRIYKME